MKPTTTFAPIPGAEPSNDADIERCLATLTQRLSLELNHHLSEIIGYSELMAEKLEAGELSKYLEHIRTAGIRAMEATRRVQALSIVMSTGEER